MKQLNFTKYLSFIFPTILSLIALSFNMVIDEIFVGINIGYQAISSISFTVPVVTVIFAISSAIGLGSSILIAKALTNKQPILANQYYNLSIYLIILFAIIFGIGGLLNLDWVIKIIGATNPLISENTKYYLITIFAFVIFNGLKIFYEQISRSIHKVYIATFCSILAVILNIIFDYLFIYEMKLSVLGGGLASGISFTIACLVSIIYFQYFTDLRFKLVTINLNQIKSIILHAASEFFIEMTTCVLTLYLNIYLLTKIGIIATSSYGIYSSYFYFLLAFYAGTCFSIVSLMIKYPLEIKKIIKYSLYFLTSLSIVVLIIVNLFSQDLIKIFNHDKDLIAYASLNLRYYILQFVFLAYNLIIYAYLLVKNYLRLSIFIVFLRCLILPLIFLNLLNIDYVFLIFAFAEFTCLSISLIILNFTKK